MDQVLSRLRPQRGRKGGLFRARHLLLTALERLTPERYARLVELLSPYPLLQQAWSLKEAFRTWHCSLARAQAEEKD